jgi:putative flippase GtrA
VRIVELDEAPTDRARIIMLLAFVSAGATALAVSTLAWLLASTWPGWLRGLVAAPLLAAGFAVAMPAAFAVHNRLVEGHIDEEALTGIKLRTIVWSHIGAAGMFTPTGRTYLLPWPLPAVALAGAAVLAMGRRGPTHSSRRPVA